MQIPAWPVPQYKLKWTQQRLQYSRWSEAKTFSCALLWLASEFKLPGETKQSAIMADDVFFYKTGHNLQRARQAFSVHTVARMVQCQLVNCSFLETVSL